MYGQALLRRPVLLKTFQRPVIEQEEDKRPCDQHGFRHEAKREQGEHHRVSGDAGSLRVEYIGAYGENPEESAQHIFTLGYPGNRFHVQGMQGKQHRHEGAAPEARVS